MEKPARHEASLQNSISSEPTNTLRGALAIGDAAQAAPSNSRGRPRKSATEDNIFFIYLFCQL